MPASRPPPPQLRVTLKARGSAPLTSPSYHPSQLRVTLNGGLEGLPALRAAAATPGLDGLMCGRCAPWLGFGFGRSGSDSG